ncbi:MAG: nitroreductase family protein [Candidatus Hydrogenedentes bacterium]|nr:nitroreductase family protein [Candidatus Hydrogenedentota bacterium]
MDAMEALRTRRSVRVYKPDAIDKDVLEAIIDCGRLAASAINIQPWEFIVVTDAAMRKRIADTTDHGKFIADAPVCVVVLAREGRYYLEDGCAATQNILVAARAQGLGSCWVAGDKKPYAADIVEMLGGPADCKLVSLIAVGYPAQVPEPGKRPVAEVLHWERF